MAARKLLQGKLNTSPAVEDDYTAADANVIVYVTRASVFEALVRGECCLIVRQRTAHATLQAPARYQVSAIGGMAKMVSVQSQGQRRQVQQIQSLSQSLSTFGYQVHSVCRMLLQLCWPHAVLTLWW